MFTPRLARDIAKVSLIAPTPKPTSNSQVYIIRVHQRHKAFVLHIINVKHDTN